MWCHYDTVVGVPSGQSRVFERVGRGGVWESTTHEGKGVLIRVYISVC